MLAVLLIGSGLGCDEGVEAPESQPPSRPEGMAEVPRLIRIELASDHHVDFYRFKDGTFAYNESGSYKGSTPVLTDEMTKTLNPAQLFEKLAPGKPLPEILQKAMDTAPGAQVANETVKGGIKVLSGATTVNAHGPGGFQTTGLGNCPFWWVAANSASLECAQANHPYPPADTGTSIQWCLQNALWIFVDQPGWEGSANACVDSGTVPFYVEHDNNEFTQVDVPAGNWSKWIILSTTHCGWAGWFYTCDLTSTGRHMKFGTSPGGVSHMGGHISYDF
jgi:hypothetical protein